jgi:hypothetical protein
LEVELGFKEIKGARDRKEQRISVNFLRGDSFFSVMTLYELETKSHGGISVGFIGSFSRFFFFDNKYAFSTKHLCELTQFLAEHPYSRKKDILSCDMETFWNHVEDYLGEMIGTRRTDESGLLQLQQYDLQRIVDHQQEDHNLEDEIALSNNGEIIPISANKEGSLVKVGEYEMTSYNFGLMGYYATKYPESVGEKPDFAEQAMQAISKSKNPIFKEIQNKVLNR